MIKLFANEEDMGMWGPNGWEIQLPVDKVQYCVYKACLAAYLFLEDADHICPEVIFAAQGVSEDIAKSLCGYHARADCTGEHFHKTVYDKMYYYVPRVFPEHEELNREEYSKSVAALARTMAGNFPKDQKYRTT